METSAACGVLWGKSAADGRPNLLVQHLLDTAAVAELIWDRFLAASLKERLNRCCQGRGGVMYEWLCGVHDVGKASPAFQIKVPELAQRLPDAGLTWERLTASERGWHHALAGAVIVRRVLADAWSSAAVSWVWPIIAGHHGSVPGPGKLRPPGYARALGSRPWLHAQDDLVATIADALGVSLPSLCPTATPRRAEQLALLGAVVMADWIASDERNFPGICDLPQVSMDVARRRAERAWNKLMLRGGWAPSQLSTGPTVFTDRFHVAPRPVQRAAVDVAASIPSPGIIVVEAPTGEGKTEAALAAAEVLARHFGSDGVFVGMPTQATADAMYSRVRTWAQGIDAGVPLALLHGKRRFNKEWRAIEDSVRFVATEDDWYGVESETSLPVTAPAEWFLGRKRGLLTPLAVGTIDQLLHAATRTKHVMLQHTGLAGRVVMLDEVHAYDVYMSQFLHEGLRWLGDGGVPVVVLSATLPPHIRGSLVRSYLQGALGQRDVDLSKLPHSAGYPCVLAAWADFGQARFTQAACGPWRPPVKVEVDVADEGSDRDDCGVISILQDCLCDGGCALVVRNTVARAQETYEAARDAFSGDVVLLHGRLTVGTRADLTERLLRELGPPGGRERPPRRIVIATQVAEQSFDVDVDLLVTDLAPMDLLLQRAGRLHRHERPATDRPPRVRSPRLVITGMGCAQTGAPPFFPAGSEAVYGRSALLRSAALVLEAAGRGEWTLPADVPGLVARAYAREVAVPDGWSDALATADREQEADMSSREARARQFLLAGPQALGLPTLAGLHDNSVAELRDEDAVAAVVRDGEPSVEVVLVRRDDRQYLTLTGRRLGITGEAVSDPELLDEVLQSAVRLPAWPALTEAARRELRPLPAWGSEDAWLSHARALVVDAGGRAQVGGFALVYDHELGLIATREG